MPGRRGRPSDPRKDRAILDAAHCILFAQGPKALTMEAVADAAQVSKATVYSRYANRIALLEAVVTREAVDIHRALQGTPGGRAELEQRLTRFVEDLVTFMCSARHQRFMQALAELPQRRGDLVQVYRNGPQRMLDVLTQYLAQASARGLLAVPDPLLSAERLLGMAMGLDLVRSLYRVPLRHKNQAARARHAGDVIRAFLGMHAGRGQSACRPRKRR
ncbi:MAG: TetR/AcrR family transcriptional regulator [Gammaproteobacteria bacterium]